MHYYIRDTQTSFRKTGTDEWLSPVLVWKYQLDSQSSIPMAQYCLDLDTTVLFLGLVSSETSQALLLNAYSTGIQKIIQHTGLASGKTLHFPHPNQGCMEISITQSHRSWGFLNNHGVLLNKQKLPKNGITFAVKIYGVVLSSFFLWPWSLKRT